MKCFIIILGAGFLLSCLPLEPIPGSFIWYNFCSNPIELRRDGTSEEIYKKKKQLVIVVYPASFSQIKILKKKQ